MTTSTFWILAVIVIGSPVIIFLFALVHVTLDRLCVNYARRFCARKGLEIRRVRCQPARDNSGVKTESTLVQLDCLDTLKQRKLVLLVVWPFGVRKLLSSEPYPDSYEEKWPETIS
jgi:hypothetical protein